VSWNSEAQALMAAIAGRPIEFSWIAENYGPENFHTTGSANHKFGSIPSGGLDAHRRRDTAEVGKVLTWAEWIVTQPLHENEALTPNPPYRELIDRGTLGLTLLAALAGRESLVAKLQARNRANVGHTLLGVCNGGYCAVVGANADPQPVDRPHLIVSNGPRLSLPGAKIIPGFARVGMRGCVRDPVPGEGHAGVFDFNHPGAMVLVAEAISEPFRVDGITDWMHEMFTDAMRRAPGLLPWGLSPQDQAIARQFIARPQDATLAREVHSWTRAALPKLPFTWVQRESGAKEVAARRLHGSSTGGKCVEVVMADGTRYIGSADDGQRGGPQDADKHHQPQESIETPDHWLCRWTSGEGEEIRVPRPPVSDAVAWRVDCDGEGGTVFTVPGLTEPGPKPPSPAPSDPKPPKKENKWTGWL